MPDPQEQRAVMEALRSIPSPCKHGFCIVELGAHTGEDEDFLRTAAPCGNEDIHYVLVEPDPRNCNAILNRPWIGFKDVGSPWGAPRPINRTRRLIIGAVSDKDGEAIFHMSENPRENNHASGSLLEPTGHITGMPWITFERKTWVQVFRLDTIFDAEYLSKVDMLWTDLQGSERAMIAGGHEALSHTRFVFMETEKVELYRGQALKDELVRLMYERCFVPIEEFDYNVLFRNEKFTERAAR
jgi:FkbM family methyltransferase